MHSSPDISLLQCIAHATRPDDSLLATYHQMDDRDARHSVLKAQASDIRAKIFAATALVSTLDDRRTPPTTLREQLLSQGIRVVGAKVGKGAPTHTLVRELRYLGHLSSDPSILGSRRAVDAFVVTMRSSGNLPGPQTKAQRRAWYRASADANRYFGKSQSPAGKFFREH